MAAIWHVITAAVKLNIKVLKSYILLEQGIHRRNENSRLSLNYCIYPTIRRVFGPLE